MLEIITYSNLPLLWNNWNGNIWYSIAFLGQNFSGFPHLDSCLLSSVLFRTVLLVFIWEHGIISRRLCMNITKCCLSHANRYPIGSWLFHSFNFHEETCLLGTGDMKCCVTVRLVTLDAGSSTSLFTYVTGQFSPCRGYSLQTVYGLKKHSVSKTYFRDPKSTYYMGPAAIVSLLECTPFVRTQTAIHSPRGGLQAAATQPLAFWDIWHPVALLMHGKVTHVTKQNHIAVLAFTIHTDATHSIIIHGRTLFLACMLALKEGLFLKTIHYQFKCILCYCCYPFTCTFVID